MIAPALIVSTYPIGIRIKGERATEKITAEAKTMSVRVVMMIYLTGLGIATVLMMQIT